MTPDTALGIVWTLGATLFTWTVGRRIAAVAMPLARLVLLAGGACAIAAALLYAVLADLVGPSAWLIAAVLACEGAFLVFTGIRLRRSA